MFPIVMILIETGLKFSTNFVERFWKNQNILKALFQTLPFELLSVLLF